MASFQQHVNISIISSGVIIVPLHTANILSLNESIIALIVGLVGGMLPDLDLDDSKPTQIFFQLLSIFIPLILILHIFEQIPILHILALWLVCGLILHFVLRKTLAQMTTHRGIFHSIPMGILFAQIALFISQEKLQQSSELSSIIAFFIFFGFIVHLLLDEIYSFNLLGIKIKKSFGTALKLYAKNNLIGTLILYILILFFFKYIPINTEVFLHIFRVLKDMKIM